MTITSANGCKCGKRMLEVVNEGTCLWCGHGAARPVREQAYRLTMQDNDGPHPAAARETFVVRLWDEDACVAAYRRWTSARGRPPSSDDWSVPLVDGEPDRPSYSTIFKRFGGWRGFLRYVAEVPREQAA